MKFNQLTLIDQWAVTCNFKNLISRNIHKSQHYEFSIPVGSVKDLISWTNERNTGEFFNKETNDKTETIG